MKIAFLVQGMDSGGTEKVVSVLSNSFTILDHQVTIIQLNNMPSFYSLNPKVSLYSLEYSRYGFIRSMFRLNKKLVMDGTDVLIAMASKPIILASVAFVFCKNIKLVTSERTDPNRYKRIIKLALKFAYGKSNLLVCPSKYVADYYKDVCNNRAIIPNPIEIYSEPIPIHYRKNIIVSVGRLVEPKNFKLLIESFALLIKRTPDLKLEIYGEGIQRETLSNLICQMKLQDKVILKGNVENVHSAIRYAKLFVCSSDMEGFPNALFEAMKLGIPVISTAFPTGVSEQYIQNNVNGFVVPCGDANAMSEAMYRIVSNEDVLNRMIKYNLDHASIFDANVVAKKWEQNMQEIINDK